MSRVPRRAVLFTIILLGGSPAALTGQTATPDEASAALRKAVQFFRDNVSTGGGYLWRYSADLSRRAGERPAQATQSWVQPPGTPTVGEALLTAWQRTGDGYYLDAARETAMALVNGQLQSGGWDYMIETDPEGRKRYAYRVDGPNSSPRARNVSTLDDDTTQSALRFLMHVDRALEFKDEPIHQTALYGLDSLLEVQYPNGAWPQRFSGPPDPAKYPVLKAGYPDDWPRTWPDEDYRDYYTFNDNSLADAIATMFEAAEIYQDERYAQAARRGGDFILLAQMPEPQPAWAQQYNAQMQPAWARKFEPPSVTGGETQGILRTLMQIYRETGDRKYLEPIPRALRWLKRSELGDGRVARFYELRTNKPLYFTKDYQLTDRDDDLPTHYAFIVSSRADRLEDEYQRLLQADPDRLKLPRSEPAYRLSDDLTRQVRQAIDALDERGAWVEARGRRSADFEGGVIQSSTFAGNVELLSRFLAASRSVPR